ncbi:hypothetical protein BTUL_0013g00470 [Botrytis tulipae]|uniref:FAD-binding PCMH-type domain-containing protein n=1 Tax=Botrytis tulipae TaxID=87230 RepID=A0A4Z1F093_9HELO|nr:hypothetical protein BTUL_0013g00470 [Botrytis tulipae]
MSSIFSSMLALLPSMAPFASYEAMSTSLIPSVCRCFPGDECYPGIGDWDGFDQTTGDKLIATVPIAAVCHNNQFATYDSVACATLKDNWFPQKPTFLLLPPLWPGFWTLHLTSISLLKTYNSSVYTGKAAVVGSGVSSQQAYEFADANNGIIVAGNCPNVALAGGYGQGGGHGPLATEFGLAVDQVLEWQVVIGVGTLVTATPIQNPDLFWALSGGGGGTYGIVLSATMKFHPKVTSTSSATLQFAPPITTEGVAAYWQTVKMFLQSLPLMVDSGLQIVWTIGPGFFLVSPVAGLDVAQDTIDSLFSPTLSALDKAEIPYAYASLVSSSFLEYYNSANFGANVSNSNTAGRLLPRSVVQNDTDSFISVLQTTVDNGYLMAGVTLDVNKTVVPNAPEISLNPYWRKTLMNADFINNTIGPVLAALTPDGAVYLNEAVVQQPNWKRAFHSTNYDRLHAIKAKYDPLDRFYALGTVGSDRWIERKDGHLCEA